MYKKNGRRSLEMMKQTETPYFDALLSYVEERRIPFHTPGHKQGKGAHAKIKDVLGERVFELDLCSGLEGLDDHVQPSGVLMESELLAAQAYGADQTFFLTNGSTQGNYTMLLSFAGHGEKVVVPRNAHRSISSALILSGAVPVYINPQVDHELHIAHNVTPESVETALAANPDAKAVMVVSPTYYGVCCDLNKIAEIAHFYGKPLLVDEAWGPHFAFHPDLPESALSAGADICVTGIHKLIGSFTQSSMLHVRASERVNVAHVTSMLRVIQSTSPSCLLLASLDVGRMQMATEGEKLLGEALELATWARERINKLDGLYAFGKEIIGRPGVADVDATRLTVRVVDTGYTGYAVEKILRQNYAIQVELSDLFNVLFNITIGDKREDIEKLVYALTDFSRGSRAELPEFAEMLLKDEQRQRFSIPHMPEQAISPRTAFFSKHETVPLDGSAGRVCSEIVASYPPGIPALSPGERITQEIVDYLKEELAAGIYIQGPEDPTLNTIKVVVED